MRRPAATHARARAASAAAAAAAAAAAETAAPGKGEQREQENGCLALLLPRGRRERLGRAPRREQQSRGRRCAWPGRPRVLEREERSLLRQATIASLVGRRDLPFRPVSRRPRPIGVDRVGERVLLRRAEQKERAPGVNLVTRRTLKVVPSGKIDALFVLVTRSPGESRSLLDEPPSKKSKVPPSLLGRPPVAGNVTVAGDEGPRLIIQSSPVPSCWRGGTTVCLTFATASRLLCLFQSSSVS